MKDRTLAVLACALLITCASLAGAQTDQADRPSVWILPGGNTHPANNLDFDYLTELSQHGFNVDTGVSPEHPVTWENLKQFNCLLLTALPISETTPWSGFGMVFEPWGAIPSREEFLPLLDRYLAAGGGVLVLLDTSTTNVSPLYENHSFYLERWGAKLPLEKLVDRTTETRHPRGLADTFVFTNQITPSPVSQGVRGIWYPNNAHSGNLNYEIWGQPLEFGNDWTVVVSGSATSHSEAMKPGSALRDNEHFTPYVRPNPVPSPSLYGIREYGGGRLGLAALNEIFHVGSGTSWVHDRVMVGKGLAGKPSDFNVLLENSLRWLSEPSLRSGALGGYQQDPVVLKHPHFRKSPQELFPSDTYQNPVPPGSVFRGLVGARTGYSCGTGTVADYVAAARRAGLDFIVFLEDFKTCSADKLRQLEDDCQRLSNQDIMLIPGYALQTNVGNHIFFSGYGVRWPSPTQVDAQGRLCVQDFDEKGNLALDNEDAKNLLWHHCASVAGGDARNIGYYNFANSDPGSVPIRNLRLYGWLGLVTYLNGKQVEDVTADYLKLTPQGATPPLCAVDVVDSPAELEAAVAAHHYLTHVAAPSLSAVPSYMGYGSVYGSTNLNPSSGPQIKCWAGLQRATTYAGEPFVSAPFRIRPLAWVVSDVGLKEIRIYSDGVLYRRFLLHGEKEFRQTFEWAYDRERGNVLEAIDVNGGRAVSACFQTWYGGNFNGWCGDRHNGELWHGPLVLSGPWGNGVYTWYSIGQTWDGGQALTPFAGLSVYLPHPALAEKDGSSETWPQALQELKWGNWLARCPRFMEGYTYTTCVDTTCRNTAGEAWNVYAPGVVANGYSTWGPIRPATQMRFSMRRAEYLPRATGPLLSTYKFPQWCERDGGGVALYEGSVTLLKDMDLGQIEITPLNLYNFDPLSGNVPTWAACTGPLAAPITGSSAEITEAAGVGGRILIEPRGYFGVWGSIFGTPSAFFNVGDTSLELDAANHYLFLRVPQRAYKQGHTFNWRYFYVWDGFRHDDRSLGRLERLRAYFGLDGKNGSALVVKRGRLVSNLGLVDLAPANGVVEFTVPQPRFDLDVPLGLRFQGFNPNWAIGQYQISGYSTGYYTKGDRVYRALATDDHGMVHLAVYTRGVPLTHCMVGHPVRCDKRQLIIEVVKLSDQPAQWRVAVNNPTDAEIRTVLKRGMAIDGFELPDKPVTVPAGGYVVVKEK